MIERPELLIGAWRWLEAGALPGWERAGWGRGIVDPATAEVLGFVRAVRLRPWRWLTAQQLEVCETEDASLVMTLRHPWLGCGRWQVIDAENRRLGIVLLPHVLDGDRGRLGVVETDPKTRQRRLRISDGSLGASFEPSADGLLLRYAAELEPNPFLRLLILGTAVLIEAVPE